MVLAIIGIAFIGWLVWGHHMFQSGMNPALGMSFMVTTMIIAVPSAIKVFNWLGTMWRGDLHFHVPMLHAVAFVAMFVIGGLSGVFVASTPVDIFLHDT
jgi:cytochrome c oxidase subunit 1